MAKSKTTSYFYAIFGIALVLVVTGLAAILVVEAKRVSGEFKEDMVVEVVLADSLSGTQVNALKKQLERKSYTLKVRYITKEEAAAVLQKDLGENFLDILGYNPLYASFLVNLKQEHAHSAGFERVRTELTALKAVKQVNFQRNILESLNEKAAKITFIMLLVAAVLMVFAVSLIFNTIRLVMFSNRFTIKTMQLFGATRWFIISPFLGRSVFNGLISGVVASLLLLALIAYADYTLPDLGLQRDLLTFALLFGALILFGILISFFSTLIAVFRYLRMKVEDLY